MDPMPAVSKNTPWGVTKVRTIILVARAEQTNEHSNCKGEIIDKKLC